MSDLDSKIDEIMQNCGMLESKYPEYRRKIKQLILKEKYESFDTAFDSHDYYRLDKYRADLLAELKE